MTKAWIGAIDQGTTSSRFLVFNEKQEVVAKAQVPIKLSSPKAGWTEQDPEEIIESVVKCIDMVAREIKAKYGFASLKECIKGIGLTNQRETTIGWDRETRKPIGPAIVWNDTRTKDLFPLFQCYGPFQQTTGLPLSTYFSAPKMRWLMANCRFDKDHIEFGTVDSWVSKNLLAGYPHQTDPTNACRTLLYSLKEKTWDPKLLSLFEIPRNCLPSIKPSGEILGVFSEASQLSGIPLVSSLGDQHAALLGHGCVDKGMTKITYGTGCFLLQNTGSELLRAPKLLSTLAYSEDIYAIEAPIAMAGIGLNWLCKSLELIRSPAEIDSLDLLSEVDCEVIFLPGLNGLLAPYWDPDAKASFLNLSLQSNRKHMVLAVLESIAFSCRQALDLLPTGAPIVMADGGLTKCKTLMHIQAAVLGDGRKMYVSEMPEATSWGVAVDVAGKLGCWPGRPAKESTIEITYDSSLSHVFAAKYQKWLQCMKSTFIK
jgi:glycerol kinase